jgi:hypothetical protein
MKKIKDLRTLLYEWSRRNKEKSNYTCKKCGYSLDKRFMHCHHVKPKSEYPDLMFDDKNALVVCLYCHALLHSNYIRFVFKKPTSVTTKELMLFLSWHLENNPNAKKTSGKESKVSKQKRDAKTKKKRISKRPT